MKQFDTFSEYMFDLLFAPLKKGRKTANQLRIFFKVMGREFDDLKAAIFRVRNEANVASCSEVMLPVHGQDRDMPRLEGEDAEAYRTRLSMKGIISQWSGTRRGVLYALTALGYDRSRIELFAEQDAERWAEFIIFLNSSKPSGVTNLSVIDAQVRKVKEGSSKPAYGMETIGGLIIRSQLQSQHLVEHLALGGEHDDRHVGELPDAHTGLEPVDLGHHQVQNNQIEIPLPGQLHRLLTVVAGFHLIALIFQVKGDPLYQDALVVHDQYFCHSLKLLLF